MSISKLNKLSPLHNEIVETINSFSLFGFELTQGLMKLKVSFVEDLDSELEDELFAVLNRTVINKKRGWTLDLDLLPVELDILRISFSRTEPLGTFQVAFSQMWLLSPLYSILIHASRRSLQFSLIQKMESFSRMGRGR